MTILETDRLLLRPFEASDFDAYSEIYGDPDVMRHLGDGLPLSRMETFRDFATLLGHWQLRGYGKWAATRRSNSELVGVIGYLTPDGWPGFELAWTLARGSWGKGYAVEGARAALGYAFDELRQDHVISLIRQDNLPSKRVAMRIGEEYERSIEFLGHSVDVYGTSRP